MQEFAGIGENLKRIRSQMDLSLADVSKLTGVSKTMLSQIERGESAPTIATMWKIANGLKVKFDTLLNDVDSHLFDVRSIHNIRPVYDAGGLAEVYCLVQFSPMSGLGYEFFYCVFKPGCHYSSDSHKNSISELIFVFDGELDVTVGLNSYHLTPGSTIAIDAAQAHSYTNTGDSPAIITCLVSYS